MFKSLSPLLLAIAVTGYAEEAILVKDVVAGVADSNPSAVVQAGDGSFIFSAMNAAAHYSLFSTDGSESGTAEIDLSGARIPGSTGVGGYPILSAVNSDTASYFLAGTPTTGAELWRYTGGAAALVKDLAVGTPSPFAASGNGLVDGVLEGAGALGGLVFKARISGTDAMYFTDGTSTGTVAIADGASPRVVGACNSTSYFITGSGTWAYSHASAPGAGNPLKISTALTTSTAISRMRLSADKTVALVIRPTEAYGISGNTVTLLTTPAAGKQINSVATSISDIFFYLVVPTDTTTSGAIEVWQSNGATASKAFDLAIPTGTYSFFTISAFGSNLALCAVKGDLTTDLYTGTAAGMTLAKSFTGTAMVSTEVGNKGLWIIKGPVTPTADDGIWTVSAPATAPSRLVPSTVVKASTFSSQPNQFGFVADDGGGVYNAFVTDGTTTTKYTGDYTLTATSVDYLSLPANDSALFFSASSAGAGKEPWVTTASGTLATPAVTGTVSPVVGVASTYQIAAVTGATGYQFRIDGGAAQFANTDGTFSYTPASSGSHLLEGRATAASEVGAYGSLSVVAAAAPTVTGGSTTGGGTSAPGDEGGGGGGCGTGGGMALFGAFLVLACKFRRK